MTNPSLPPSPSLEYDKKQAKALLKAYQAGDVATLDRIQAHHPKFVYSSHEDLLKADFKLADAQLVIAREYGLSSWTKLKRHIQSLSPDFKDKVALFKDGVYDNNVEKVRQLLEQHPNLRLILDEPLYSFDSQAIVVSSSHGNVEMVKLLTEYGADIDIKSEWWAGGFSALYHANPEITAYLLEHGATIDIHVACKLDMLDKVKEMVAADPELVNAKGGDGQRPLHYATTTRIMDILLENGADINARDVDHYATAAQWAVHNVEKCRYLIDKGADVDLFVAISVGDANLVKRILENSPEVINGRVIDGNFEDGGSQGGHIYFYILGYGMRPLKFAAQKGNQEVIDVLLSYASVKDQFLYACVRGDEALATRILDQHPKLMETLPAEDRQLISDEAWENNIEGVRLMLKLGFDVNTPGEHQSTPIDRAALCGFVEMVQMLIEHGASLTVKNEFGGTPLGACVWGSRHHRDEIGDYPATVEALLKAGAPFKAEWLPTGNDAIDGILQQYVEKN